MAVPDTVPELLQSLYVRKSLYISRGNIALSEAYSGRLVELCAKDYLRLKPLYLLFRELADIGQASLDA